MNGISATPNVVIVGRPNVGKSALFNRLIRRRTAIVHDQPGITRDRISAVCTSGAFPFTVWDTGGIGGTGESELTKQVRSVADEAVREGDLLLFMVDAQQGLTPSIASLPVSCANRANRSFSSSTRLTIQNTKPCQTISPRSDLKQRSPLAPRTVVASPICSTKYRKLWRRSLEIRTRQP